MSDPHGTTLDNAQFSKLSQLSLQGQMKWIYANRSVNWNSKFPCSSLLAPCSSRCAIRVRGGGGGGERVHAAPPGRHHLSVPCGDFRALEALPGSADDITG